MIKLSNDHEMKYVVASGALAFDGKGWFWERILVWIGLIRPELFTVVLRTVTLAPRLYPVSNLSWWRVWTWLPWSPWSCIRFLPNSGVVNRVGLYNPGFDWFRRKVVPRLDFKRYDLVASLYGTVEELVEMTRRLNRFPFVAIEVNVSCPNTGHKMDLAQTVIDTVKQVQKVSMLPIIVKVSVDQDYLAIAAGLKGVAEAISINSVPWSLAFPHKKSPLNLLEKKLGGGGGGGVSGRPAQHLNWKALRELAQQRALPVIAPSIMNFGDMDRVRSLGAQAYSFGAVHLEDPTRPTKIILKERVLGR